MFRKALTVAVVLAVAATTILAQERVLLGSIAGRAMDAAGRGVEGVRVELMNGSLIVGTATTNTAGDWSIADVKPGDYVARVNIKGRITGVRLTVVGGQQTNAMIVVSTASVAPQLGALIGVLSNVVSSATVLAVQTAVGVTTETDTTELNDEILEEILSELTPAERQTFANAVLAAIEEAKSNGAAASPFAKYETIFENIATNPNAPVPDFGPPTSQS
jgi:hypothetical protein